MAASDPTDALQNGIYDLLRADTGIGFPISFPVGFEAIYDGVPEQADPAWVIIGETLTAPDGVHGLEGRQTSATIHSWARADSFKSVNDMGARIVALLWHRHAELDAAVTGHKVWRVEHEFSQTLTDPDPELRHRVDRFRVWSHQEAP